MDIDSDDVTAINCALDALFVSRVEDSAEALAAWYQRVESAAYAAASVLRGDSGT